MEKVLRVYQIFNKLSLMNFKYVYLQEIQIYNDITTLKANEEAKKEVI